MSKYEDVKFEGDDIRSLSIRLWEKPSLSTGRFRRHQPQELVAEARIQLAVATKSEETSREFVECGDMYRQGMKTLLEVAESAEMHSVL